MMEFRWWIISAVVIFGAANIVASKQHRAAAKYHDHRTEYCSALGGTAKEQIACKEEKYDAKQEFPWWYVLYTWPEGFTTWAIICTGFVIAWQSNETRKAADATRDSVQVVINKERARIRVQVLPLWHQSVGRSVRLSTPDSIPPEVEFVVHQYGPTSAIIEATSMTVEIRDSHDPKAGEDYILMKLPAVMKEDVEERRACVIHPLLAGELLQEVRDRKKVIHFYGIIRYRDVFRQDRETGFYYTWRVHNHPAGPVTLPDRWVKRICPGYDQEN